jgi:hypothetical protein
MKVRIKRGEKSAIEQVKCESITIKTELAEFRLRVDEDGFIHVYKFGGGNSEIQIHTASSNKIRIK